MVNGRPGSSFSSVHEMVKAIEKEQRPGRLPHRDWGTLKHAKKWYRDITDQEPPEGLTPDELYKEASRIQKKTDDNS